MAGFIDLSINSSGYMGGMNIYYSSKYLVQPLTPCAPRSPGPHNTRYRVARSKAKRDKVKFERLYTDRAKRKNFFVGKAETTAAQRIEFNGYKLKEGALAPEDSMLVINPFNKCVLKCFQINGP